MDTIQDQAVVSVTYTLREDGPEGAVVEQVEETKPFTFLYGGGYMLKSFEENLGGKEEGDSFAFTLKPEEAYGEHQDTQILDVPMDIFKNSPEEKEKMLQKGMFLTLTDQNGQSHIGQVLEVSEEAVKMDFNHAMAGKTLHFTGEVLNIREATPQEQKAGRPLEG